MENKTSGNRGRSAVDDIRDLMEGWDKAVAIVRAGSPGATDEEVYWATRAGVLRALGYSEEAAGKFCAAARRWEALTGESAHELAVEGHPA